MLAVLPASATRDSSTLTGSLSLFGLLLAVYLANCGFLVGNDSTPNVYLPLSLLREGNASFTPREVPGFFEWSYVGAGGSERVDVPDLAARIHDRPASELLASGELVVRHAPYFLVPTRFEGAYVSTYGPGPGLVALPLLAALELAVGDLDAHPALLWFGAKLAAAMLVAASGSLVWLAALRLGRRRDAWFAALAYGLGTGAWSTASQALWQQAPALLFVALGAWLLLVLETARATRAGALASGLAWGAAAACRPPCAVFVVAAALYVTWRRRSFALPFAAGIALGVAPLLLFDLYYFGAPFETGQAILNREVARHDTGVATPFRFDSLEGVLGLLVSPARGLLIYSPVALLALAGLRSGWRQPAFAPVKALCAGAALLFAVSASFIRWWGGWSFGPRYLLEAQPILALCMVPALPALLPRAFRLACLLLAVSVGVQAVGAFAYDVDGWNNRRALVLRSDPQQRVLLGPGEARGLTPAARSKYRLVRLDVDRPANHARLWSIVDSPLVYYVAHFEEARREKERGMRSWFRQTPRLAPREPGEGIGSRRRRAPLEIGRPPSKQEGADDPMAPASKRQAAGEASSRPRRREAQKSPAKSRSPDAASGRRGRAKSAAPARATSRIRTSRIGRSRRDFEWPRAVVMSSSEALVVPGGNSCQ